MIFRAAFWIAFVAVFMPHEPDVGYGRPNTAGFLPTKVPDWMSGPVQASAVCGDRGCAGGPIITGDLRSTILSNLDRVKAELKQTHQAGKSERSDLGNLAKRVTHF